MWTTTLAAWFSWTLLGFAGSQPTDVAARTTLGDLQIAYNLECNARLGYLAYADQADRQGLGKVASLLRAAAKGEQIHAASHAAEIERLGGTPMATLEPVRVRSLRANLAGAIAQETYERDHMYKWFGRTARDAGLDGPLGSFERAREAETTHATLLRVALEHLDHMKVAQTFFVCPRCGSLTTAPDGDECLGCGAPVAGFARVN